MRRWLHTASVMAGGFSASSHARSCCLTLLLAEATTIPVHRFFVRGDVAGEFVSAGVIGARHEVERVDIRGLEGGANAGQAGIGDGPRGEPRVPGGIVGVVAIQIAA